MIVEISSGSDARSSFIAGAAGQDAKDQNMAEKLYIAGIMDFMNRRYTPMRTQKS